MLLSTVGDRTQAEGRPLPAIGGKGLFTEELESALRSGAIDLAVHALKDLPVADAEGVVIGAVAGPLLLCLRGQWSGPAACAGKRSYGPSGRI